MIDPLIVELSTKAATPTVKIAGRVQIEATALATRRAQAYMEIPAILARCHSGQDLLTAQVMFWQQAQRQYAEGFEHLAASIQSANGAVASSVSPRGHRTVVQPVVPLAREPVVAPERPSAPTFTNAKPSGPNPAHQRMRRSA